MESESDRREAPARSGADAARDTGLFRQEALQHHLGEADEGDVLRLSPSWTRWTYWLLLAVIAVGLSYLVLGSVAVYESGPAILRIEGRSPLTAESEGTVESVEVQPGQRVESGRILVRFRAQSEQAELAQIQREFELHLAERLRDPADETSGSQLRRLRAERERIQAMLEEKLLRAPREGVVSDVRIRPGQFLSSGEPVLTLVPTDPEYSAIILLPGHARPQVHTGNTARLEILGYPYAYTAATIVQVGDQVIGPAEARRFLGPEIGDSVRLGGPVVLVQGRVDSETFSTWEGELSLHDGMIAEADVEVRRERLLTRLIPGLKALRRQGHV